MNGAGKGAETGRPTMPFRAVISSLCIALFLLSAAPSAPAWAQNQDETNTAKKKKTTNSAPKKSGGGDSQSSGTPGDRGTGSY
jgi:hypothetical protein